MNLSEALYKGMESARKTIQTAINEAAKDAGFSNVEELLQGIVAVQNWTKSIHILAKSHYAFTDVITDELIDKLLKNEDVDNTVKEYYVENNNERLNRLIIRCKSKIQPYYNSELLDEIITAFENGSYHLSCVGLFAVIDGLLSQTTLNNTTNYKNRFKTIHDKISRETRLSELDKTTICLYYAFENIENTAFQDSRFHEDEPLSINRHWTLHGRSRRNYEIIDCIMLFQWIEAIIIMDNFGKNDEA